MSYADSTRGVFWKKYNKWIENIPKKYVKISGGDFNACLVPAGIQTRGFGPYHPSCCYQNAYVNNDNRNELLHSIADQNMFLENTYFKNSKSCHSWTQLNVGKWKRRPDYLLVNLL